MTIPVLLEKIEQNLKITKGKKPMVLLPLRDWEKIENILEDLEMIRSKNFIRSIREARREYKLGKVFQFNLKTGRLIKSEVKK